MAQIQSKAEKIRFLVVGCANTAIDFGIFITLSLFIPPVAANFISTSVALLFSYVANKKYTFKTHNLTGVRHIALFLSVTLVGLWGIQPVIIAVFHSLNHTYGAVVGKIIATGCTLVWNYLWYKFVIFKKPAEPTASS